MWKLYAYEKCSTCRQAIGALKTAGIAVDIKPIRDTPPTLAELQRALTEVGGSIRKLFNTSGLEYRAKKMGELLPTLSDQEALAELAANGSLVKRPFLVTPKRILVGYKAGEWEAFLQNKAFSSPQSSFPG